MTCFLRREIPLSKGGNDPSRRIYTDLMSTKHATHTTTSRPRGRIISRRSPYLHRLGFVRILLPTKTVKIFITGQLPLDNSRVNHPHAGVTGNLTTVRGRPKKSVPRPRRTSRVVHVDIFAHCRHVMSLLSYCGFCVVHSPLNWNYSTRTATMYS